MEGCGASSLYSLSTAQGARVVNLHALSDSLTLCLQPPVAELTPPWALGQGPVQTPEAQARARRELVSEACAW